MLIIGMLSDRQVVYSPRDQRGAHVKISRKSCRTYIATIARGRVSHQLINKLLNDEISLIMKNTA